MTRIHSRPRTKIFDEMMSTLGCQDLDLLMTHGQTLAGFAATCIHPDDVPQALDILDKLLDGHLSTAEIKGWLRQQGRFMPFKRSRDVAAFLSQLRDHLKH